MVDFKIIYQSITVHVHKCEFGNMDNINIHWKLSFSLMTLWRVYYLTL